LQQEYEAFEPLLDLKEARSNRTDSRSASSEATTPSLDSSTHAAAAQNAARPMELLFSKEVICHHIWQ
jgi:hypothetical protein